MKKHFSYFLNKYHKNHPHNIYVPFYDTHADYNTNAKSYYDYLARMNMFMNVTESLINRLLDRDIEFNDTSSIDFTKNGDWIDNGECEPNHYDDLLSITANVKISTQTESKQLKNTNIKTFTIKNGTKIKNDGIWSPNYDVMINEVDEEIGRVKQRVTKNESDITNINNEISDIKNDINSLENEVTTIKQNVTNLTNGLQKIVNNLHTSGAISSNNINNFTFKNGRNIATGNINLFGGTQDGNSFIRTSDNKTSNDISAGY